MIAALYVMADGIYSGRPDVDCWDITRDARKYDGPHPVVAHPPCQLWGAFAACNYARWGGEHNRPGNDGGCFAAALESVRRWGGVLEHPSGSRAWASFELQRPLPSTKTTWTSAGCDGSGGMGEWTCEVWQSAYGHRANKATWLLYVGNVPPSPLNWSRVPGSHQCGFQDQRGKARNKPTLSRRESNATPPAFAELLLSMARSVRP